MKRYIKSLDSIDTSNSSFKVGTRWVDIATNKIFTITKVNNNCIHTDGFNASLPPKAFVKLLKDQKVRPTKDYFSVSSDDEFLGYLSKYDNIDSDDPFKYILYISTTKVYAYTGMSKKAIQKLRDDLMLHATNYEYVDGQEVLELGDLDISCEEK